MKEAKEETPPPFGSWPRLYVAVVFYLVLIIAGFTLFTKAFNR